jgi:hypothetical protein
MAQCLNLVKDAKLNRAGTAVPDMAQAPVQQHSFWNMKLGGFWKEKEERRGTTPRIAQEAKGGGVR